MDFLLEKCNEVRQPFIIHISKFFTLGSDYVGYFKSFSKVSRSHASLLYFDQSWYIQDGGSKTGVYVNLSRIGSSPVKLNYWDIIGLGGPSMDDGVFVCVLCSNQVIATLTTTTIEKRVVPGGESECIGDLIEIQNCVLNNSDSCVIDQVTGGPLLDNSVTRIKDYREMKNNLIGLKKEECSSKTFVVTENSSHSSKNESTSMLTQEDIANSNLTDDKEVENKLMDLEESKQCKTSDCSAIKGNFFNSSENNWTRDDDVSDINLKAADKGMKNYSMDLEKTQLRSSNRSRDAFVIKVNSFPSSGNDSTLMAPQLDNASDIHLTGGGKNSTNLEEDKSKTFNFFKWRTLWKDNAFHSSSGDDSTLMCTQKDSSSDTNLEDDERMENHLMDLEEEKKCSSKTSDCFGIKDNSSGNDSTLACTQDDKDPDIHDKETKNHLMDLEEKQQCSSEACDFSALKNGGSLNSENYSQVCTLDNEDFDKPSTSSSVDSMNIVMYPSRSILAKIEKMKKAKQYRLQRKANKSSKKRRKTRKSKMKSKIEQDDSELSGRRVDSSRSTTAKAKSSKPVERRKTTKTRKSEVKSKIGHDDSELNGRCLDSTDPRKNNTSTRGGREKSNASRKNLSGKDKAKKKERKKKSDKFIR